MPYVPKTGVESFDSDWQKAQGWAQTQGISINSVLPVYQMDLQRLQNGEYPMGTAERNLSIIAANNPKQVTSSPSDQPASPFTPSGIYSNTVSDVGKIATGLAGIFTGSFERQAYDSLKETLKGITDPAALDGGGFTGTVSNWLNNTLLAYVPGSTDIATLLTKGPEALLEHPVVSLLDVAGAYEGLSGIVGKLGGTEAEAAMETASGGYGLPGVIAKHIGDIPTSKFGASVRGGAPKQLNVSDVLQNWMANLPGGGVGKAIGDLAEQKSLAEQMPADKAYFLVGDLNRELSEMSPAQQAQVQDVLSTVRTDGGDKYRQYMENGDDPAVKRVISGFMDGPARWSLENNLFSGDLRATYTLSGDRQIWAPASKNGRFVLGKAMARNVAHRMFLKGAAKTDPLVARVKQLDDLRQKNATAWDTKVTAARKQVFNDPKLQVPLTRDLPKKFGEKRKVKLSKKEQLHMVVGQGGLVDTFKGLVAKGDPDQILSVADAMLDRLSAWGPDAVDAGDHPALMDLRRTAEAWKKWAQEYQKAAKQIDDAIYGTEKEQRHFAKETEIHERMKTQALKDQQNRERDGLLINYNKAKRQRMSKLAVATNNAVKGVIWQRALLKDEAKSAAARATPTLQRQIASDLRQKLYKLNRDVGAEIKQARLAKVHADSDAYTKYQLDSRNMTLRFQRERVLRKKAEASAIQGTGELLAAVVRLGDAVRGFQDAVADTPADQYKDVVKALLHKNIREHESTSALVVAFDKYLRKDPEMTEKRLAQLHSNPQVIAELIDAHFNEIVQPDLDPELAEMAKAEMAQYKKDAHDAFTTMYNQKHDNPADDFRIQYIPTATTFDETVNRGAISARIGHGIPKPDMVKGKISDLTPQTHDFVVGINKAVFQELDRQAKVNLAEHYLKPMAITREELLHKILLHVPIEEQKAFENSIQRIADAATDLGYTAFDPVRQWGFTLPRWSKTEQMYLPTTVVKSLKAMDKVRNANILSKSNELFRYSILGLSPRYDAHMIFGGTMMAALRATPYMATMIPMAWRSLRDGTLDPGILRGHVSELGFEETPIHMVLDQAHNALAKDAVNGLAVPEHIETRQKIKMAAAKPVHVLKALADINFRMMEHVRYMQTTLVYFDAVAKADRKYGKVPVEDPMTGEETLVSSDRAIKEGMHAIEKVYGNLNRMSPVERQIAQTFMPFYGWQKHILSYVLSFPFDHPWRAMILSQLAYNSSNDVPAAWPIRLQFLHFLGAPDAQGNVDAIDLRSLDPFRDVANYASWTGLFESLNPAISAIPSIINPEFSYGSSQLYPGVTYNAFYGIETSTNGGDWVNALSQFVPQVGAVQSALSAAQGYRTEWSTDPRAATETLLEDLNIPFVTPSLNLKQLAAKGEDARFEAAKNAAYSAFQSGDFSGIQGYKSVPNPLNDAYEITPAQLEAMYRNAQQQNPGVAPIESLLPPPTPYGW